MITLRERITPSLGGYADAQGPKGQDDEKVELCFGVQLGNPTVCIANLLRTELRTFIDLCGRAAAAKASFDSTQGVRFQLRLSGTQSLEVFTPGAATEWVVGVYHPSTEAELGGVNLTQVEFDDFREALVRLADNLDELFI